MGELGAASRVCDERPAARGALDPAPSSRGRSVPKKSVDNADDFIDGVRSAAADCRFGASQLAGWELRVVGQFDVGAALRRHLAR